jgi:LacI family transcriptional regulator
MTVSRVLNNRPHVSKETRELVQQVIKQLGYSPSVAARSMKGHSNTLGVVASGIEFYGPSRTLAGIEYQANEFGFSLLLNLIHDLETQRAENILSSLLAHQVEGIIWAVPEIGDNRDWLCEQLRQIDIPVVFTNMQARPCTRTVAVDNYEGARLATEHLIKQGHRQIGIITGPDVWWESRQRELAWYEILRDAGVTNLDSLRVSGDWSPGSGEAGLYQLLEQKPDLEAIFACNDNMALGAMCAAHRLGRRIPQELSIVGFDDIPESAYFFPPLTTIKQGLGNMGSRAVRVLRHLLEEEQHGRADEAIVDWVTPQLIVRESSCATISNEANERGNHTI